MVDEQKRHETLAQINQSFFNGLMSPSWYTDIDTLFKKYGFEDELMIALFQECYGRTGLNRKYILSIADSWHRSGIKKVEDLKILNRKRNETFDQINQSFFRGLMYPAWYTIIHDLFEKYEFEDELMIALFQECYDQKKLSKQYILTVADSWNSSGIKKIEDLKIYQKNWRKSKRTYTPEFTDNELKLIYHAMIEIKEADKLNYVEADELELNELIRRKIEKLTF